MAVEGGPWLGTVTRLDAQGRVFVRARALSGDSEYGPLLRLVPGSGGAGVLTVGDQVLVSAVDGQRSVYVVLGRLV